MITVKMMAFSRKCVEQGSYAEFHAERLRRLAIKIIAGDYI
ncbi:hypothetical protein [Achromobacter marplatensis]|nr:hypothetical protein [Achromobacter marplatensis]